MGQSSKIEAKLAEEQPSPLQEPSQVMYIGHLPHGFYEDQLRGFFSQFGPVTRLRVSRNKKTGNAKHYAFLEFKSTEVAQIAAEAMDGYMLFAQKLVCHVMPTKDIHKDLWKGANKKFKRKPWKDIEIKRHDKDRTPQQQVKRVQRAISRDRKRRQILEDAGIKYEYKTLQKEVEPQIKTKRKKLQGEKKGQR